MSNTNELNTPCKFLLFSELPSSFNFCYKPDSLLPLAFRKLTVWTELSISNRFSRASGTRFMEYHLRELNISKIKRQFCVRILIICDKRSFEMFQFRSQGRSTEIDLKYVNSTQACQCFQMHAFPKASGVILWIHRSNGVFHRPSF